MIEVHCSSGATRASAFGLEYTDIDIYSTRYKDIGKSDKYITLPSFVQ